MIYTIAYIAAIAAVNYGFSVVPLIHGWPPLSLAVGGIFVLRDLAQREVGHWVIFAMLIGGLLSWFMADPFVAFASVAAFAASESMEWAVFTITRKPLRQRVVWSVLCCTPIDSGLFLFLIGAFSPLAVAIMTASKLMGAVLIYGGLSWRLRLA